MANIQLVVHSCCLLPHLTALKQASLNKDILEMPNQIAN